MKPATCHICGYTAAELSHMIEPGECVVPTLFAGSKKHCLLNRSPVKMPLRARGGLVRMAQMTPTQRSNFARTGGIARHEKFLAKRGQLE